MRRAVAVGVLIVLVTGTLVGAAAATALATTTAARSLTRIGGVPRTPVGTRVVGSLADTTRISGTITLQPPNPAALQSYATAVSTPGSSDYRQYLSVAAFRARFAPADAQIAAVRSVLSSDGLRPSPVSANGLAITLSGTATQLSTAFSTSFDQVELSGGRTAYANTSAPAVPSSIASTIQSITGLNSLAVAHPLGLRRQRQAAADRTASEQTHAVTGGPQACDAGRVVANPAGYTADDLASAYGFSGLYGQNDFGAGQTIGLLELQPYAPSDVSAYASCYGITPSVATVPVDGSATGPAGGEATNDIEDVIGLAPRAPVLVYEAPNTTPGLMDVLVQMVSDDQANVMSTSWGLCEAETSIGFAAAENVELEEAATQGQSFFAAAGDAGSADCNVVGGPVDTELSVDDPGAQPFITAVGGTQLSALGPPPTETAWNDGQDGGGGGISRNARMPDYQLDAAPTVGAINGNSSGTPCGAPAGGFCRETPDVSASSSMTRGYDFYEGGAWTDWYGTSFAAPLWAAYTALANASPGCVGTDIGFVNPLLYQLAGSDYGRYFNDITTGNNDVNDLNGGLYPASTGYDMATGLGSPIGTALAQGLCGVSLTPTVATTVHDAATTAPWTGTETAGASAYASASVVGGGVAPSGTLMYDLYADAACTGPTLSSQAVSLTVGGVAPNSVATAPLTPGSYSYRAAYSGDPDYDGVDGPCVAFTVLAPPPTPTPPTNVSPPTNNVSRPASIPRAVILKLKIAKHTNATITFTATAGRPQGYQCALAKLPERKRHHRAAALRPDYRGRCSSPVIYRHLKAGHYAFFVRAKGVSGGYSSAAKTTFTIVSASRRRPAARASSAR